MKNLLFVLVIAFTVIGCCSTRELSDTKYLHNQITKIVKSNELSDKQKVHEINRWLIIYGYRK